MGKWSALGKLSKFSGSLIGSPSATGKKRCVTQWVRGANKYRRVLSASAIGTTAIGDAQQQESTINRNENDVVVFRTSVTRCASTGWPKMNEGFELLITFLL